MPWLMSQLPPKKETMGQIDFHPLNASQIRRYDAFLRIGRSMAQTASVRGILPGARREQCEVVGEPCPNSRRTCPSAKAGKHRQGAGGMSSRRLNGWPCRTAGRRDQRLHQASQAFFGGVRPHKRGVSGLGRRQLPRKQFRVSANAAG